MGARTFALSTLPATTLLPSPPPPAQIFPVKLTQEAIFVDVSTAQFRGPAGNRGGAGTSIDNNNVFTVGPTVYFDGMDPTQENATPLMTPNAKQVCVCVCVACAGAPLSPLCREYPALRCASATHVSHAHCLAVRPYQCGQTAAAATRAPSHPRCCTVWLLLRRT